MKEIVWASRAARDLDRIDGVARRRIIAAIESMAESGRGDIRRFADVQPPEYRLRVGDWRIRFALDETDAIVILRVLPRDKAYR